MPSIRYINQSAPFWDFVANMEREGTNHPFFGGRQQTSESEGEETPFGFGPWGFFPHRPHPHPHHPGHRHHRGPPSPPPVGADVPPPPFAEKEDSPETVQNEKGEPSGKAQERESADESQNRGRCGPGGFGRRGHCGPKRGGPRGFGRGPFGRGGFPFGQFANLWNENKDESDGSFKPEADVFDTENAYIVHLSVPGAKKEDISVTWDAEKSEVAVSGIVHRPGDEEFLKTLAMDERKVGLFERKIRLGSLANPAQVDVDAISAKLEDGILRVEIPKQDKDYVEVKMVDIE